MEWLSAKKREMSCKIWLKLENNSFKVQGTTQAHNGARVESRAHMGKGAGRGADGQDSGTTAAVKSDTRFPGMIILGSCWEHQN